MISVWLSHEFLWEGDQCINFSEAQIASILLIFVFLRKALKILIFLCCIG